jgi:hypothetical protein
LAENTGGIKMRLKPNQQLMDNIDKGIRAGVKKALQDHKKAGIEIAVWEKGKVKIIPPNKIRINP